MGRLLTSLYYDFIRATPWLGWGPGTDPNKAVHIMAHFTPSDDWPRWCRLASLAPHVVKGPILNDLPGIHAKEPGTDIVKEVENIRLQKLTHYKCHTMSNHEFIRADYFYATTNTPLVAVWERDLILTSHTGEKKRGIRIKSGVPCEPLDRVTYISEENFQKFVTDKHAYKIREATFPSPGPTQLQVAAVLETHSLMFPAYHLYSTMCYWYADSTYEVLVDLSDTPVQITNHALSDKGMLAIGPFRTIAYTGTSRKGESASTDKDATGASFEQRLVNLQKRLIDKYEKKGVPKSQLEALSEVEQQSIKEHGWNLAQFLKLIQDMPTHDAVLTTSKTRAAEVRAQLELIQSGCEAAEDAERRKNEASIIRGKEEAVAMVEAKWKKAMEEQQKKADEQLKKVEEQQKKAMEEQQKKADEQLKKVEEKLKKAEERQKKAEEQQKKAEEQLKKVEEQQR